ncbi:10434_t:CDS:1, partial [Acaulospora morrowiae]
MPKKTFEKLTPARRSNRLELKRIKRNAVQLIPFDESSGNP